MCAFTANAILRFCVPPATRVLGSLLSAHRIITDSKQPFGDMTIKDYDNELLHMAHDLAVRLLPAFENTKTGIPYPRVGGWLAARLPEWKSLLSNIFRGETG